jgi:hypothetical protein
MGVVVLKRIQKELLERIAPQRKSFTGKIPALPTLGSNLDSGLVMDPAYGRLVGQDRRSLEEMDASA